MRSILMTCAVTMMLVHAAPARADVELVVFGPIASTGEAARTAPAAAALASAAVGTPATKAVDVACTTDPGCLVKAGAAAGARRALAVVLVGGGRVRFVLVDVIDHELVARREVAIPDGQVDKLLRKELAKFLADAPTERAKLLFAAGNRHYELGEYAPALAFYRKAYRVKPLPAFLFNIAQCHRKLDQHAEAIQMYQSYLVGLPNADNKALVESLITESQNRIAEAQQHERDRQAAELEAGKQRAEHARKTKEAEAQAEAERRKITQAKLDAERARELDRTYNKHPARKWTIATGIVGVAAIGTGGYFGYRTRQQQASFDDAHCGDPGIVRDAGTLAGCNADRDGGKRDALLTNVFLGGGGTLLVISAIVFAIDPGNIERPEPPRTRVVVSPTSFAVQVKW